MRLSTRELQALRADDTRRGALQCADAFGTAALLRKVW